MHAYEFSYENAYIENVYIITYGAPYVNVFPKFSLFFCINFFFKVMIND